MLDNECQNYYSRLTRYQKGKTSLDLNDARDDEVWGRQWHLLDYMQTICTSLQTDKSHKHLVTQFFTYKMFSLTPNQQCQKFCGKFHQAGNKILMTKLLG